MSEINNKTQEDRALDALIVAALRHIVEDSEEEAQTDLREAAQYLTDEDRAALASLGPDFVERVMSGDLASPSGVARMADRKEEMLLETAMARGGEDDLPQDVREEMERRLEQAEEDEANEDSPPSGKERD